MLLLAKCVSVCESKLAGQNGWLDQSVCKLVDGPVLKRAVQLKLAVDEAEVTNNNPATTGLNECAHRFSGVSNTHRRNVERSNPENWQIQTECQPLGNAHAYPQCIERPRPGSNSDRTELAGFNVRESEQVVHFSEDRRCLVPAGIPDNLCSNTTRILSCRAKSERRDQIGSV